jgi:hypothetical protein
MTQPNDFLGREFAKATKSGVEINPIVDTDALQEAVFIDARFDLLHSSTALLFSLGSALQFRTARIGVIVLRGIFELNWIADEREAAATVWNVVASEIGRANGSWDLSLGFHPNAQLLASCSQIDFIEGSVFDTDALPFDTTKWLIDQVWTLQMSEFGIARTTDL